MNVVYSFNKRGYEAVYWSREIAAATLPECRFVPFNHDPYLDVALYSRAQLLDNLYYQRDPRLLALYRDLQSLLAAEGADVLLVDNCFPYHPDWLRGLDVYKVLRTSDGPIAAYDRDFAYLHAYDHVLYHSPAYSADLSMEEKLRYCGARRIDFWPLALFDTAFDAQGSEDTLFERPRDIDVLFIGALHFTKMPVLAALKKAFGRRFRLHGLAGWKRNLYFNARHGWTGWVRPVAFEDVVPLYRRAKIGVNLHNRGQYTVGNYRLFDLAGNGVMQLSDGGAYLSHFLEPDREVVGFSDLDELIEMIRYYLANENARMELARNAYRRVMRDHRFSWRMRQLSSVLGNALRDRRVRACN